MASPAVASREVAADPSTEVVQTVINAALQDQHETSPSTTRCKTAHIIVILAGISR
jgi:hypothetical protein